MNKKVFTFILIGLVLVYIVFLRGDANSKTAELPLEDQTIEERQPMITKETFPIEKGDVFATVMERMGYSYEEMQAVLDAGEEIYDFTKIKAGKTFVIRKKDGVFDAIVYDINSEEQALITQSDLGTFAVARQDIPYNIEVAEARGTIESSLFVDGNRAGLEDRTILELADVFAWEIDFATVLQQGDTFSLVYEKRFRDGEAGPDGRVLAATFTNSGKRYTAVRFEDPDGGIGYYSLEGESLQKPFLKAPLRYSRISSGYSNARFHPVTKQTTPHLAIDYAAPVGTPILAVGDGVVKRASYNGGYGHFISIRHNDTWVTQYAHLSRYAVRAGDRVEQGQVIGYVGNTGWSTGPHLHYEMVKNGSKVNPLTVEFPAGDPIKEEWKDAFEKEKATYNQFFAS